MLQGERLWDIIIYSMAVHWEIFHIVTIMDLFDDASGIEFIDM